MFWSGHRKLPTPPSFDLGDEEHIAFIGAASRLYASAYSIIDPAGERLSDKEIAAQAADLSVEAFAAANVEVAANEEERKKLEAKKQAELAAQGSNVERWDELVGKLPALEDAGATNKPAPEDFEKDDDTNRHMDFITAASNIRARSYGIRHQGRVGADRMATKQIAGRIIPAIATTTAMTTGAVMLELFKFVNGHRNIDMYRRWYFNLGINVFNEWAPSPCAVAAFASREYSKWNSIEVLDMSLADFLAAVNDATGHTVSQVQYGSQTVYQTDVFSSFPAEKQIELHSKLLSELVASRQQGDADGPLKTPTSGPKNSFSLAVSAVVLAEEQTVTVRVMPAQQLLLDDSQLSIKDVSILNATPVSTPGSASAIASITAYQETPSAAPVLFVLGSGGEIRVLDTAATRHAHDSITVPDLRGVSCFIPSLSAVLVSKNNQLSLVPSVVGPTLNSLPRTLESMYAKPLLFINTFHVLRATSYPPSTRRLRFVFIVVAALPRCCVSG